MLKQLEKELKKFENKEKAKQLQRFFKTGKGEYGEGDVFLGISVPNQRKIAKRFINIELNQIQKLLKSKIHEKRLITLLILIEQYNKAKKENNEKKQKQIFNFYLDNTKHINNWDLVDLSAHKIVGDYLLDKNRKILYKLAKSNDLWEKRISIISCFAFIKDNDFADALKISEILLNNEHARINPIGISGATKPKNNKVSLDLIHKAVGWMLREVGKKNQEIEEKFLKKHYKKMPRTMLRYAIEKFDEDLRQKYLKGKV